MLRASGFLDFLAGLMQQFTGKIGFPGELVPLTLVKMFSSSAATGLLLDVFKEFGTDSYIGLIASISMSCTETIFYTMSVYFMAAKVTRPPLSIIIPSECKERPQKKIKIFKRFTLHFP